MPRETKVTDNSLIYDPAVGKVIRKPWFEKGAVSTTSVTNVKRKGVVRKNIVDTENYGKDYLSKDVRVQKFDKSGKLKKTITLSNENGKMTKSVAKPGEKSVSKRVGLIAKTQLRKKS